MNKKGIRFILVGTGITLFDYIVCMLFSQIVPLGVASVFAGILATVVAYFAHSNITWKQRKVSTSSIIKFFVWNAITMLAIRPFTIWVFGFLTGLYQFAFMICEFLHIPFSYEFVESTGIYVLAAIITMTLNYLFYDKFVFGNKEEKNTGNK